MKFALFIMSLANRPSTAVAILSIAVLLSSSVLAQSSGDPDLQSVHRWNDALTRAETYARVRSPSDFGLLFHREQLGHIREEASRARGAA